MNILKNIFWKDQEHRLRMGWRLILQGIVLILLLIISEVFLNSIAAFIFNYPTAVNQPEDLNASRPAFETIAYLVRGLFLSGSVWIAGRFFDRRKFTDFGFNLSSAWWKDFVFGLGLGAVLMAAIFLVELSAGWIRPTGFMVSSLPNIPFAAGILFPLLIFISVGFYEELFSRGYQLTNLAEGLRGLKIDPGVSLLTACLISSAFFGFLHAANPNATILSSLNIGLAGILLATGFILTGELAIPIGLHISWNFFQGNVFGFPVSGAVFSTASVFEIQQLGPQLITGGRFGPEGGLIGTGFTILGILLTIFYIKKNSGKVKLQTAITMPPERQNFSIFDGIQHVIWDWNGTLLDDLDLCIDIINSMLKDRNLETISKETYLEVFGFPVQDYYLKIGFDFSDEPFEDISTEFITAYENGRSNCSLMAGSTSLIKVIHQKGLTQSILSASKKSYLDRAIVEQGLVEYFNLVDGLDNHHAAGKLSLAREHLQKLDLPAESILLIGDTMHDAEISAKLGLRCCLIPSGHYSRSRLEKSTATMIDSILELKDQFLHQE